MRLAIVLFICLGLSIIPAAASAHPHIFARYRVTIGPGEKSYNNLHFTFTFQGVPNPILTPGTPANDQQQIKPDMLANLNEHPFYLYLDMDGQSVGRQQVRPVPVAGDTGKDKTYVFDLTVPVMVKNFAFALYDPTYFSKMTQKRFASV